MLWQTTENDEDILNAISKYQNLSTFQTTSKKRNLSFFTKQYLLLV